MPFVSRAQMKKFGKLLAEGRISQATFDEWKNKTRSIERLPERVRPAKGKRR
jgi:hypothetical protein